LPGRSSRPVASGAPERAESRRLVPVAEEVTLIRRQAKADRTCEPGTRAALAALLLAIGLALSPVGTGSAAAATGRLLVSADASYVVAPADRAVHVSVAIRLQNDKPSTAVYYYFWREISWTVQLEATKIAVRDASGALKITAVRKPTFQDLSITLRRDLLYKQVAKITLTYDLPDGGARSGSNVHVGTAFVAFEAWTWGDDAKGSLLVRVPDNFTVTTDGSFVTRSSAAGMTVLTATAIADPFAFYVDVSGLDSSRLSSDPVSLAGGVNLVVRGWPEDTEWRSTVVDTLKSGLPVLMDLIGLPWKPTKPLEVSEAFGPNLEGYAGLYLERDASIRISDNLDKVTILHEATHIWFNSDLFTDRWIDEGFAQQYSVEVAATLGVPATAPKTPLASSPGFVPLVGWQKPGRITAENEASETYGYNASWYVIRQLATELGKPKLQAVIAAADADQIAYVGSGPAEKASTSATWQRFLDLLDIIGGSKKADELFRTFVVDKSGADLLEQRAAARLAYAKLVDDGDGWAPPLVVRQDMSTWQFPLAMIAMTDAGATLQLRSKVDAAATDLGLEPGGDLREAYESAGRAMSEASDLADKELDALAALKAAHDALAGQPDLVTSIGLLGTTPALLYDAAAAAYEADDLDTATSGAGATLKALADAPAVGRERLEIGGGGAAVVLLGGGGLLLIRRRRRVRTLASLAAAPAAPAAPAVVAEAAGAEPYATLAADPPDGLDAHVEAPVDRDGGPPGSGGPGLD
jgi:hypothetical protein